LISAIEGHWTLPPLILHPFSGDDAADSLLEGSKASLMLNGLIPNSGKDRELLNETVLRARVQEIRMLYFLGKDLFRWTEQCVDFVERTPELRTKAIRAQSFAALLVENPPTSVSDKLQKWGVTDQRSVFSRALGIISALTAPPTAETFSPLFLHRYHRFLDYLYVCYQNLEPFTELNPRNFSVEIYASAEYSQLLEDQWTRES
jgi:hypothetical protein